MNHRQLGEFFIFDRASLEVFAQILTAPDETLLAVSIVPIG